MNIGEKIFLMDFNNKVSYDFDEKRTIFYTKRIIFNKFLINLKRYCIYIKKKKIKIIKIKIMNNNF